MKITALVALILLFSWCAVWIENKGKKRIMRAIYKKNKIPKQL